MSQEDMKRLLKDGKIVGYMYHSKGKILFAKDIKNWLEGLLLDIGGFKVIDPLEYYIKHDSFEQGIKVGDEWWFINDRGKHIGSIHDEEEDISKGIKRKLSKVLDNVNRTIHGNAQQGGLYASALSGEGYDGGYADAIMDIKLALNGVPPKRRDWWDEPDKEESDV